MIKLVVNGTSYNIPESGEDPNWAQGLTDWCSAVTDALESVLGPGDILSTTFAIDNNITVASNVNGLLFDSGTVRAANVDYAVYRTSTANPAGNTETGTMFLIFDDSAAVGSKWSLSLRKNGDAGVTFAISDAGQISYLSTDIGTAGYSGTINFRAKALTK